MFWACAKAPCPIFFNLVRARLAKETRPGAQAILNTHPQHWSRALFKLGSNCDSVDNNLCESFNKWIVEARFFPIITMLEAIRRKIMVRIQEQMSKAEKLNWGICPNIKKKLNAYIKMSGYCHAISNGADKFEVKHWDHRFTVDLQAKTCSCRYWQLSRMSCCHAISSIYFISNSLDAYIADCYSVKNLRKTYMHCLEPVEGQDSWPTSDRPKLRAPGYIKMPSRPKTQRTREPHEKPKATKMFRVGTVIRCAKCKCTGHNSSSCDKRSATAPSGGAASGSATRGMSGTVPSAPPGAHSIPGHANAASNQVPTSSKRKLSQTIGSQDSVGTTTANAKVHRSTISLLSTIFSLLSTK